MLLTYKLIYINSNPCFMHSSNHIDIPQNCFQLGFSLLLSLLSYKALITRTNYQIRYFAGKGNFLLDFNNIGTIYVFFFFFFRLNSRHIVLKHPPWAHSHLIELFLVFCLIFPALVALNRK